MKKSLLHVLWRQFLRSLGLDRSKRSYDLDEEVVRSLQQLAEAERRPESEVASDLLSIGLAQHQSHEEKLARWRQLTPREQQIAAFICLGYTNTQIAIRLDLSHGTVKAHVSSLLHKMGLERRYQLHQLLGQWDFSSWEIPDP